MKRISIHGGIYLLAGLLSLYCLEFLQNGWMVAIGIPVLIIVILLTWRQFLPNVFAFILVYHWLQVIAYPFFINTRWGGNPNFGTLHSSEAFLSALAGILVMAVIINRVAYRKIRISENEFSTHMKRLNPVRVLYIYLALYFMSNILGNFGRGALAQIFINIALLKWVGYVLLGYICTRNKIFIKYFVLAFFLELAGGFFSYFSYFKFVFFYISIVLITYIRQVSTKVAVLGIIFGSGLFYLFVIWTAVKGEYREFLIQGSNTMSVQVSQSAALDKLTELVSSVNGNVFDKAVDAFYYRLQYVYHLAKCMDMVPQKIPYQDGAVWKENIEFVTVPRIIDPNKGILDASVKASKFTGINYSKSSEGVSFSLGYFAECYVDFGIPGMFLALAIIALLWSWIYRFFLLKATSNLVINYAIIAAFFIQFGLFEKDGVYMAGRLYSTFVVFVFLKYTVFKRIERYITTW